MKEIYVLIPIQKRNLLGNSCFAEEKYRDYAVYFIYNKTDDKVIYCENNCHSNPDEFFNGYCSALDDYNIEFKINKGIIILEDFANKYNTKLLKKLFLTKFDECVIIDT